MKWMKIRHVANVMVLLSTAAIARPDAGDCLAIWVDTQGQPAECAAVHMRERLDHLPDVCAAESAAKAVIRVKLIGCSEGPKAAIPTPGTAVIQYVIDAQVAKGKVSGKLTGRGNGGWDPAIADLCRGIVGWHGGAPKS